MLRSPPAPGAPPGMKPLGKGRCRGPLHSKLRRRHSRKPDGAHCQESPPMRSRNARGRWRSRHQPCRLSAQGNSGTRTCRARAGRRPEWWPRCSGRECRPGPDFMKQEVEKLSLLPQRGCRADCTAAPGDSGRRATGNEAPLRPGPGTGPPLPTNSKIVRRRNYDRENNELVEL
jgi:hypothetical protein